MTGNRKWGRPGNPDFVSFSVTTTATCPAWLLPAFHTKVPDILRHQVAGWSRLQAEETLQTEAQ